VNESSGNQTAPVDDLQWEHEMSWIGHPAPSSAFFVCVLCNTSSQFLFFEQDFTHYNDPRTHPKLAPSSFAQFRVNWWIGFSFHGLRLCRAVPRWWMSSINHSRHRDHSPALSRKQKTKPPALPLHERRFPSENPID
jgi:hypothetical protein